MPQYKPIWVRPETHRLLKTQAARRGLTMVDYMEILSLEEDVRQEAEAARARAYRLVDTSETYSIPGGAE